MTSQYSDEHRTYAGLMIRELVTPLKHSINLISKALTALWNIHSLTNQTDSRRFGAKINS